MTRTLRSRLRIDEQTTPVSQRSDRQARGEGHSRQQVNKSTQQQEQFLHAETRGLRARRTSPVSGRDYFPPKEELRPRRCYLPPYPLHQADHSSRFLTIMNIALFEDPDRVVG